MSWAEVGKINRNMKKPLNTQLHELNCSRIEVIEATSSYKPAKTGLYRVICVGAGGTGWAGNAGTYDYCAVGGGGGGVAVKDLQLSASTSYSVTISTTASFSNLLTATAGETATKTHGSGKTPTIGGTASGGDYNFGGLTGEVTNDYNGAAKGGSVGVAIAELTRSVVMADNFYSQLIYGDSLLKYGGGAPAIETSNPIRYDSFIPAGMPAAVLIMALEVEV